MSCNTGVAHGSLGLKLEIMVPVIPESVNLFMLAFCMIMYKDNITRI